VKEGRAGPSYSIRDEKGKSVHTKVKEKLSGIMTEVKALMATVEALNTGKSGKAVTADKKGKTEDRSSKDDKEDDKDKKTEDDSESMPNVLEAIQALSDKIDAISKTNARDEDPDDADRRRKKDKEESTEDADEEEENGDDENDVMARLDRVEAAVAKILKKLDPDEESEADEDADTEDAKNEGGDTGTEDEMPKSTYTGDSAELASQMEILAPGKKFKGKGAKRQALVEAYKTEDGKAVIDKLTGKKGLTKDSAINTDMLFTAAAELLAEKREEEMAGTKRGKVKDEDSAGKDAGPMTAEKLNAMNAEYYNHRR
jgi:hypothetical protein